LRVEYLDDVLRHLATRADYHPAGWPGESVTAYRRLVQCIYAAGDDRDLRAMRSLRLRQQESDRPGSWEVQLDPRRQVSLRFKREGDGSTAILELLNSKADLR